MALSGGVCVCVHAGACVCVCALCVCVCVLYVRGVFLVSSHVPPLVISESPPAMSGVSESL